MPEPLTLESGANPKAAQVRIATLKAASVGGQRAHDLRIGPQPAYVAKERSDLNRVLVKPDTGTRLRAICEERRALRDTARAMKSNASVGVAGIITFGIEAQRIFNRLTSDQQDAAYRETAEAVAARLNTTLTGLVVHVDESAPHAHFQLPAYDMTGQPISETAKRGAMRDLQTITAQVMGSHAPGIERGRSISERLAAGAHFPNTVHKSVTELHQTLPADLAARRAQVDQAKDDALKAQARVDEMQARVDKLTAKETDLTAKEAKNLAIYEKRLADRQEEALKAERAAEEAKAEVDRLTDMANHARAAAEKAEKDREIAEVAAVSIRDKAVSDAEAARLQSERETAVAQSKVQKAEADASAIREKAAKDADAAAAAFLALAIQIRAGTITQDERGKIVTADSASLRPGGPVLIETARMVLPLVSAAQVAKEEAAADRAAAAAERQEVAGLRQTLMDLVGKVQQFLRRPDVSRHMKAHEDGQSLTRDVLDFLRKPKLALEPSPAPEKPIKDADGPDGP